MDHPGKNKGIRSAVGRQRYPQYRIPSLDAWIDKGLLAADVRPSWDEFKQIAETAPQHLCRDYAVRFARMLARIKELREHYSPCSKAMASSLSERRLGMLKLTRLLRDFKRCGPARARTKAVRPFLIDKRGSKAYDATGTNGCPGIWIETKKGNKFLESGVYIPRRVVCLNI